MSDVFKGFDDLEVFVDSELVHIRQFDEKDSWIVIPHHLWAAVCASVARQLEQDNTESAE